MPHLPSHAAKLAPLSSISGMPLSRLLLALALIVGRWELRMTTRKALIRLDDHLLRDIGIEGAQANDEARKPFWQD